ncbi:hypothetical protein CDL12_06753 [Handroanthus impetiginosus]|uniref:Uncharacterized protein n=1 Tax=Handroanthus impetiginosus TaxID=429701 RepID=A0A2G9HTC8_9LAMI|nr:hypothetical protein CDL12_06753 [Handroanthus impetiginosus]
MGLFIGARVHYLYNNRWHHLRPLHKVNPTAVIPGRIHGAEVGSVLFVTRNSTIWTSHGFFAFQRDRSDLPASSVFLLHLLSSRGETVQSCRDPDDNNREVASSELAHNEVVVYDLDENNPDSINVHIVNDPDLGDNPGSALAIPVDKEACEYLIKSSPWIAIVSNIVGHGPSAIIDRYGIPPDYEVVIPGPEDQVMASSDFRVINKMKAKHKALLAKARASGIPVAGSPSAPTPKSPAPDTLAIEATPVTVVANVAELAPQSPQAEVPMGSLEKANASSSIPPRQDKGKEKIASSSADVDKARGKDKSCTKRIRAMELMTLTVRNERGPVPKILRRRALPATSLTCIPKFSLITPKIRKRKKDFGMFIPPTRSLWKRLVEVLRPRMLTLRWHHLRPLHKVNPMAVIPGRIHGEEVGSVLFVTRNSTIWTSHGFFGRLILRRRGEEDDKESTKDIKILLLLKALSTPLKNFVEAISRTKNVKTKKPNAFNNSKKKTISPISTSPPPPTTPPPRPPAKNLSDSLSFKDSPSTKRLRRPKELIKEMSWWRNQVVGERDEEDGEQEKHSTESLRQHSQVFFEVFTGQEYGNEIENPSQEAVWVKKNGECSLLDFKWSFSFLGGIVTAIWRISEPRNGAISSNRGAGPIFLVNF